LMLRDSAGQPGLYQPSSFWAEAAKRIAREIHEHGVERFRSTATALNFFVPTYGTPGNSLSREQANRLANVLKTEWPDAKKAHLALDMFLSGEAAALADYRVLLAADGSERLPSLREFSES